MKLIKWVIISGVLIAILSLISIFRAERLEKRCLKIPEDVSFVGFDGGESFDLFNPPLTFIKQPLEEMGRESFTVLMDLMKGSSKVSKVLLTSELIIRSVQNILKISFRSLIFWKSKGY